MLIKETPFINCQFDYFYNTLNLFKRKYNFKDCKYDNYQCEKETDNNNKALCGRKIIFDINNISLNDKKEVILIIIQLKWWNKIRQLSRNKSMHWWTSGSNKA